MNIGNRIRSLREDNGYTLTEFANKIGVSKQTLYKYENGIITNIPSDKIENMAKVCGVSPSYIMGWEITWLEPEPEPQVTEDILTQGFRRLSHSDQGIILQLINSLLGKKGKTLA